jgi:hypothetical protein
MVMGRILLVSRTTCSKSAASVMLRLLCLTMLSLFYRLMANESDAKTSVRGLQL